MDPRRLLTFRTVAHERSFSRAAETLSLSQPSVSHQIGLLETEIGVRLLDRGRRGLRLTRAGEVLLEHADHLAWRLQLADSQIADLAQQHREHVRFGAFPTALASFVPSAIARLRSAHGDVQIQLRELIAANLEPRLLAGEFDVAVGYQDATTDRREIPGAERIDLFQETFLVGLPPDHRLAGSTTPISLDKFAEDDWIVPSTEGFLIQACRDAGFDPRIVAVTSDPLATRGLITRGLGVGWVASLLIHDYAGAVVRPVKDPIRRRDVYALLPPGNRHPLARPLINALIDTAPDTQRSG
ncbi:MAG TPA: LysR family transcriptional regulator [Solirubrobacteraceae bacterium]|nr:LysR family transcriptional regulator [Solirubrobacteraceae bacterium]